MVMFVGFMVVFGLEPEFNIVVDWVSHVVAVVDIVRGSFVVNSGLAVEAAVNVDFK